ncbi:conserved hypothetical protein [Leishmania braziliensis MHOM/BR/75/M2904]|uniref:Uncharacterized protein n=2 Tax=Leishmania braziliensis TaxID=5660 RepID=A4H3N1_LEIBR|nr:conserved hypothetical protein [Leishmania braziliensis MHOM/BR/75/M2904]CAJ2465926.1 unnamed protein product [Leishmania braziliensis]CAM36796.1 conserved hypothetical protein [Leishmania braziliensis MHOM/BR/75/M2904]SYZ62530.1 hypothetical_protein [Leishmania braziliensis MHOM/BR/75/M2904]
MGGASVSAVAGRSVCVCVCARAAGTNHPFSPSSCSLLLSALPLISRRLSLPFLLLLPPPLHHTTGSIASAPLHLNPSAAAAMPTKQYIQLLQKLFVYLKRNSGRNVPHGISQVALIDDDDLTRWFIQLLYKDENNADFYVSLELVFSEDDDGEDGAAGRAWGESTGVGGARSLHRHPARHVRPSATAPHPTDAAPYLAAATSPPPVHRHDMTTTSSSTPSPQSSFSLVSGGAGGKAREAAACDGSRELTSWTVPGSPDGSSGSRASVRSTQQQRSDDDPNSRPTTTTPEPYNELQRRPVDLGVARLQTGAAASPAPPVAAARGGSRRIARMPLVFVVAPRLIASFIHHGALCSLELMSQHWELTPENIVLLLVALYETLNPFAGDGRVSVDDAERMESRREAAAAAGVDSGGASPFTGAYSEEEHQLGMEYIHRAHPHLFRRYVDPTAAHAGAVRDGATSLPTSESRGSLGAPAPLASHITTATAPTGGGMVQRAHHDMYLGRGSAVAATGFDSVRLRASPHEAQTAATTLSFIELGSAHSPCGSHGSGALAPHVLRDMSRLNTAVYDALVATYAPPAEPLPASPPPPLHPIPPQQPQHPTAATTTPVVMLLDSSALLADAEGVQLFQSGVRGVQQTVVSTTAVVDCKNSAADSTTPDMPAMLQQRTPSTMTTTPLPLPSAAMSIFTPVMNAERVLRARPPALSHVAYAPTPPHRAATNSEELQPPLQQRVAELWIPLTLPPPPIGTSSTPATSTATTRNVEGSGTTQVLRLSAAGVSCEGSAADDAAAPFPLEVHLLGDTDDDVQQARVACVLRNMRVSVSASREPSSGDSRKVSTSATQQHQQLRFSLQSSTAPSPTGDVHTCQIPCGLTLHCRNMYLYGHLRVFGGLVLHNCVFVGTLTTEELATVQVSHTHLALMPDDRLLQRLPPYRSGPFRRRRRAGRGAPPQRSPFTASPGAAAKTGKAAAASADTACSAAAAPPPPPALFYAQRKECVLVLDSSRVEMSEDTHVYRLMPYVHTAAAAVCEWRRSSREVKTEKPGDKPKAVSHELDQGDNDDEVASISDDSEGSGNEGTAAAAAVAPSLAAMMTVLRSLILVSNHGHLRLVRCTVNPGRHTERSIFAEQDAIVDMAHCTVTAAITSAVSVQGCRAYVEHCLFEGSPTTTAAATSPVQPAEAVAGEQGAEGDGVDAGGDGTPSSDRSEMRQQTPPPPIRVSDTTRCTGLNVELGGTLTARHCTARHLYFAFCVIAHSVAHFYRCHAEDVVNGFTVDASAATLDGCSANTNHVGAFVLRKAKCILTDDRCGSFPRRCSLLGEAHETAYRAVMGELLQKQQERKGGVVPPAISATESLWTSAAAVAERTARVARLARRHYEEQLPRSDTLSDAASATATAIHASHRPSPTASEMSSPQQTLGFFGGRFSLEVRDAALKATGVTLMNAHDTSVYAYEDSVVELEECVLWSTAEAEEAANAVAATVAAALGSAASPAPSATSATALKLTGLRASNSADGGAASALRSGSPRQRSCGVKAVHASLKARRCLMTGYSFGVAAIQSTQAELQECMVVNGINGYTIDHSQCRLQHCGADTSHVGLFALNNSRVEAHSTPHVVGVSACGRTPPPLICGGVPAVFCGDVYGVESQSSEVECTGITVLRGRDSGFNAYNRSVLRLTKCLVDVSPTDAARYVFHSNNHSSSSSSGGGGGGAGKANAPGGGTGAAAAVGGGAREGKRGSSNEDGAAGKPDTWTRYLTLDVSLAEELVYSSSDGAPDHPHHDRLPSSVLCLADQQGNTAPHCDEVCEDEREEVMRPTAPAAATPPLAPSSVGRSAPAVRTSGVKVWSGSQCHAQDTEVRCVTFGFASLGPETLLDAHHCTAKHVVNGFTSDGGALQLTKCSASSNHVGVYILSHAHCVVRRGSYTAKKYGIECRSGLLSLQGHVKIYGFSRIGLYLYDGAHCEADPDCVLDIHALKHASPWSSAMSSAAVAAAARTASGSASSTCLLQPSKSQQQPPMTTASATSFCSPEDVANVSDLLPACIALDEATAHLPQAVLGGGARCGITCGDGATGFIGKSIVYDCSLVGVNVFYGAHLTLANALLRCAQQYAVVVHAGGVCRITRKPEGDETVNNDHGPGMGSDEEAEDRGAGSSGGMRGILGWHGPGAAVSAAVRRLRSLASHIVAVPWRVAHQWAVRSNPNDGAAAAAAAATEPVVEDGSSCGTVLANARARSFAPRSTAYTAAAGRTAMPPALTSSAPRTPRHPPPRVTTCTQRLSSDASLRRSAGTRSAASASSATATTASPVTIRAGDVDGALLAEDEDEEVGGSRSVPLTRAVRRRLKWLCWEAHLDTRLPFRLNTLVMPVAAAGANSAGPEPVSTAVGVGEQHPLSPSLSASVAAPPRCATVPLAAVAAAASIPAAPAPGAPSIASAFPAVRPAICGSCVVRGTCTMERVVLRPTNHLPRHFAECSRAGGARKGESKHDSDDDEDGSMGMERDRTGNTVATRTQRSPWAGQGERDSSAQHNYTDSTNWADDTTSAGEVDSDSAYASPLLATTTTAKATLAAGRAVAAATARATDSREALPSVRILHHLMRQPPAVHVCQQGVLSLTDCIVDASLSLQPHLGIRRAGQLTAVVACEGPYAKLHCDYVRIVRSEGGDEEDSSAIEGGDSGASAAAPVAIPPASTHTPTPAPSLRRCGAVVAAAAADVTTVPLLLLSLADGAQCTLHMVGTSLNDWPYCAYTAAPMSHDGNDVCSDPTTRQERENTENSLGSAGHGGAAVTQLSPARLTAVHNAGIMLRTTGDTLAEVAYASITAILASQRSQVRLTHCTVTGTVPIILGSSSCSSLKFCRVVGGVRAGPTAAAIRVGHDAYLTLIRSSVWTLSRGLAVECMDSGCVQAIDSEELTLGTAAGPTDGPDEREGAAGEP